MIKSYSVDEKSINKLSILNLDGFQNEMMFYNDVENSPGKEDSENVSIISK